MRVRHAGYWLNVPAWCISGLTFRIDNLAVSGDVEGVVIHVYDPASNKASPVKVIVKIGDRILCPNVSYH